MMATQKPKGRGCVGPTKIASRLRFDAGAGSDLTTAEIAFGAAMSRYKARWKIINPTCAEILDVMMDLGYVNDERNFETCIVNFAHAMHAYKKIKRFPTWSEALSVALSMGWRKQIKEPQDSSGENNG